MKGYVNNVMGVIQFLMENVNLLILIFKKMLGVKNGKMEYVFNVH